MTIRRSAAAVGAVALGLLALSACSRPTPVATVTVGESSAHTEAACYDAGKALATAKLAACEKAKAGTAKLKVDPDLRLHLGVDPDIAGSGWYIQTSGGRSPLMRETYRSFDAAALFENAQTGRSAKSATLDIVQTAKGSQSKVVGVWKFTLESAN